MKKLVLAVMAVMVMVSVSSAFVSNRIVTYHLFFS